MIATIEGRVSEKLGELVVIETSGVGYGLLVTSEDFGALAVGASAKVYVHEHVREQAYDLFGFTRLETKKLFEQLLAVNGVGPKMALAILSIASGEQVRGAIASGDTKFIARASGVGKRVAERIVIELKDKVGLVSTELDASIFASDASILADEAAEALVSLGYSPADASKALANIDKTLATSERIKLALKETR
jgi:Holliday junction DNA helicase RuvA